jgi:hypothetical protein
METDSGTGLVYQPLEKRDGIRLVVIERGSGEEDVCCRIIHSRLPREDDLWAEEPGFEALSYEWGKPNTNDAMIFIDGIQVRIRRNLHAALLHIRNADEDRHFWIDALCINQSNVPERNHQVELMGKIYSSAKQVVVWLGHPDELSKLAMKIFAAVAEISATMGRGAILGKVRFRAASSESNGFTVSHSLSGDTRILISPRELKAVRHWANRSYWYRVWIIQEIILARQLVIYCGESTCSATAVLDFASILSRSTRPSTDLWAEGCPWSSICDTGMAFKVVTCRRARYFATPLRDWIIMCRYSTCTEPYDSIYAFLGVASDIVSNPEMLVPSYDKEPTKLFKEALRICNEFFVNSGLGEYDREVEKILARRLRLGSGQAAIVRDTLLLEGRVKMMWRYWKDLFVGLLNPAPPLLPTTTQRDRDFFDIYHMVPRGCHD